MTLFQPQRLYTMELDRKMTMNGAYVRFKSRSCGLWHRAVKWKDTNVSEGRAASIFWVRCHNPEDGNSNLQRRKHLKFRITYIRILRWPWPTSRYCPSICIKRLRKVTKYLSGSDAKTGRGSCPGSRSQDRKCDLSEIKPSTNVFFLVLSTGGETQIF
jgi:hypothetical protein